MPVVNGVCVPGFCMHRRLDQIGASLMAFTLDQNRKIIAHKNVTNVQDLKPLLNKGLSELKAQESVECHGCVRSDVLQFLPPAKAMAVLTVKESESTDIVTGVKTFYQYQVYAGWEILSFGVCVRPGTLVKINNKFIPIEDAPNNPQLWPPTDEGDSGR